MDATEARAVAHWLRDARVVELLGFKDDDARPRGLHDALQACARRRPLRSVEAALAGPWWAATAHACVAASPFCATAWRLRDLPPRHRRDGPMAGVEPTKRSFASMASRLERETPSRPANTGTPTSRARRRPGRPRSEGKWCGAARTGVPLSPLRSPCSRILMRKRGRACSVAPSVGGGFAHGRRRAVLALREVAAPRPARPQERQKSDAVERRSCYALLERLPQDAADAVLGACARCSFKPGDLEYKRCGAASLLLLQKPSSTPQVELRVHECRAGRRESVEGSIPRQERLPTRREALRRLVGSFGGR